LLYRLKERFESEDPEWICGIASGRFSLMSSVASALAESLEVVDYHPSGEEPRRLGRGLANQLKIQRVEDIRGHGVVILVDLDGYSSIALAEGIINEFEPGMWEALNKIEFTPPRKQKPFRMILTGRHLTRELPDIPRWKRLRLSPFDYKSVYETASDYLVGHTEHNPSIKTVAAHILHFTGGHPGCMARLLRQYREKGLLPDEFLVEFLGEVNHGQDRIVKPAIDGAYNSIGPELRGVFSTICVFRYLTTHLLKDVLGGEHPLLQEYDEHDLADELTKTQYLHRDGYLLEDDITRRLLAIRLRRDNVSDFVESCRTAKTCCEKQLRKPTSRQPAKWAIECLFQFLQQYAGKITVAGIRDEARGKLLEQELPRVVDMLVDGRDIREEFHVFQQELTRDWEFRFTLNYFLRRDQYDESLYQDEFLREVKACFI
jgi:hypothetical protein